MKKGEIIHNKTYNNISIVRALTILLNIYLFTHCIYIFNFFKVNDACEVRLRKHKILPPLKNLIFRIKKYLSMISSAALKPKTMRKTFLTTPDSDFYYFII